MSSRRQARSSKGVPGALISVVTLALLLTLIHSRQELRVLAISGHWEAALSSFAHQLWRWTLSSALVLGGWWLIDSALFRSSLSPRARSVIAATLAAAPVLILSVYRDALTAGIYLGNWLSVGFLAFAARSLVEAIITWVAVVTAIEVWRCARDWSKAQVAVSLVALFGIGVLGAASATDYLFARGHRERPPNVLLIVIDALRPDHLGTYGYSRPTSPNIDLLADKGIRFDTAISQSTLTKTSIASLFTGLYPHHHGVYSGNRLTDGRVFSDVLSERLPTLAGELQSSGYLTTAWLQQSQLKSESGYGRGFHFYNENSRDIRSINRRFLAWVDRVGTSTPWFAYLHYIDLHDPYRPSPPFDTLYGDTSALRTKLDLTRWTRTLRRVRSGELPLDAEDLEQLIRLYDGQITFMDQELGRLFEELDRRSRFENSMIILTSDHGDGFMEHGFISHSVKPYDELIRVPLIVHLPGEGHAGVTVREQVRLIDVMPSILDRVGSDLPPNLDGHSLWPLDKGPADAPVAISEVETEVEGGYRLYASVRTPDWKLIAASDEPWELYDLQMDPGERVNRIEQQPQVAEALGEIFQQILEARDSLQVEQTALDEQTEERLRALGYIE